MSGEHARRRTTRYKEGWVAWCSCGMGSPAKATKQAAEKSLRAHTDNPREFPK